MYSRGFDSQEWERVANNKYLDKDFVVVKSFSGAKSSCMNHYIQPTLDQQPENIIIHCGTNDLSGADTVSQISAKIIKVFQRWIESCG